MESVTVTAPSLTSSATTAVGAVRRVGQRLFGDDGFDFKDVLDLVNPLQHIPVVGNLYRKLTGDVLAPAIRVAGGALFGGPLGAGLSLVGLAVENGAKQGAEAAAAAAASTTAAATTPATAVAAAPSPAVPRGGWMIAAATTGRMDGFVPDEALASNAAVAAAEAAPADAALSVAAIPSQGLPPTSAMPAEAGLPTRELHLPARRAIEPRPLPPTTPPLADAAPRSDPRALARFVAWQTALERATTGIVDRA